MTNDTINEARTIAGNAEGNPSAEKGTTMDKSIGDGPTMRPKDERIGRGAFAPGDVIAGRYVVEKVLGEGGMGIVYQCLDKVGGVSVAVKCLPPEVSRNADEMEDIRANYRLVADLHHQNIAGARTLELDESTGDYYLVMDLARGTSLKRWMKRNPQATTEAKLAILRQIAAALDYAHAEKVIHRDVKPENVMVDDDGRVKVLDFGLAAQIRSSQSRTSATVASKGGTPGYKSPEQWLGRPQREPADVYSFGVMAYWMFAGELPFDGDDPVVLGHAVLSAPVEPVAGLPAHMNAALVKALAKNPEERFASCGAVVDALEGIDVGSVEHVERVDGVGGARRPAEPVGSRVPRDRTGGPQSGGARPVAALKGLLAAMLIAALASGAWWLASGRNGTKVVHAPPVSDVPVVPSPATNAPSAKPAPPPKAGPTDVDVKAIADEAGNQEKLIKGIDDEQGYFKERKNELAKELAQARKDRKEKRWAEAAQGFTNYVNKCAALLNLNQERQSAKKSKAYAEDAKARASEAEASHYAEKRWNEASASLKKANDLFDERSFIDAASKYKEAAGQFGKCENEARTQEKLYTAAKAIRFKALEMQPKLKSISDEDGFYAEKKKRVDLFSRANACFDEKEKRWAEAAQGFTNYVRECEALIALDVERHTAKKSKTAAKDAKDLASKADAAQYVDNTFWNEANTSFEEANGLFSKMHFADATLKYDAAASQFELCVSMAKHERERQEVEKRNRERENAIKQRDASGSVEPGLQRILVTGYCSCPECCGTKNGGLTATGSKAQLGTIAADPSIFPFGTQLNVPGYGDGVVEDTGSRVKGYHIAVWFPTHAQAKFWGSREMFVALPGSASRK